jgi:hypothetical protein
MYLKELSKRTIGVKTKAIYIYQAMTLTKGSGLWNGLPQPDNIASPTFTEKNRNPLNLSLYLGTFVKYE